VISVIGQALPEEFSQMIRLGIDLNAKDAYPIHYKMVPFIRLIFDECNPAGIKALLAHKGICKPYVRLPLVVASEKNSLELKQALDLLV
jgi:4-hydroxy-tetrahydrodipicolinate synthase